MSFWNSRQGQRRQWPSWSSSSSTWSTSPQCSHAFKRRWTEWWAETGQCLIFIDVFLKQKSFKNCYQQCSNVEHYSMRLMSDAGCHLWRIRRCCHTPRPWSRSCTEWDPSRPLPFTMLLRRTPRLEVTKFMTNFKGHFKLWFKDPEDFKCCEVYHINFVNAMPST